MIKLTVSAHDVVERARVMGRMNNFEYDGWHALFEYLEDLSDDTGQDIDLDIVALCCKFTRFEDVADYNAQYGTDFDDAADIDQFACFVRSDCIAEDGPAFICYAH